MKNKKNLSIIGLIFIIVFISAIFYTKRYKTNSKEDGDHLLTFINDGDRFISSDKKISFEYPKGVKIERENDQATFFIVEDVGGNIGEMTIFGFNFRENRQGKIGELYKENIFYKDNQKNYYGKNEIIVSGRPAILYKFSDTPNPSDKDMINEIIFEYNNNIYSFEFSAGSQILQTQILNSVKLN